MESRNSLMEIQLRNSMKQRTRVEKIFIIDFEEIKKIRHLL